ncbi:hypothetical protein M0R45_034550 [Rubus argutus]|uniref:Ion transport domain-containing protein n=1 Tax=Rubus argutus TaxID=59490 RepID=A0AAW1VUT9_RUBAR
MKVIDHVLFSTPDPDLEGGSEKEARGHGVIASPKFLQVFTEAIQHAKKPTITWNTTFIILCSFAVFIDPLYCYIHIIAASRNCYYRDEKLFWAYFGLRSTTDVFYAMDIFYFLRSHRAPNKLNGKTSEICREREQARREDESFIQARIHKLLPILLRILVALPIPETGLSHSCSFFFTPFQYSLRIYHIYGSLRRRPVIETGVRGRWLKAFLDFLPFIIASHLFGAMCHMKPHVDQNQISIWEKSCPIKEDNPYIFDFGIYSYALQSNLTVSTHIYQRMLLSFWWALRNLSSVGSNLQTSTCMTEIFFSILISTSGILLFLVYLNAKVQVDHLPALFGFVKESASVSKYE